MLTFHNDQKIKDKYIARLQAHAAADEIVKGYYWEKGKGCAVGCTIHGNEHSSYEGELGIPRLIAYLEDGIFEGLPNDIAKDFPLRFLSAVPVGVDLSIVFPKFMYWLLIDPQYGVYRYASEREKIIIKNVADLYLRKSNGENIEYTKWKAAADAAYAAADAAYAAADAAAASAAYAAAAYASAAYAANAAADDAAAAYASAAYAANAAADDAAAAAAAAAAYAAAAAAAYAAAAYASAARQEHRIAQANKLIELIESTKQ